jgi:hypothetical protein
LPRLQAPAVPRYLQVSRLRMGRVFHMCRPPPFSQ